MELQGKIINFLGDSITEGARVEDIQKNRYDNVLKEKLGLKRVNNYGIGGSRIAHRSSPSKKARYDMDFCARAYDMDPEADVIVVFGGVNDYLHGDAPFGRIGDTERATFCGSVDTLCSLIPELYPQAKLVFLTPARCFGDEGFSTSPDKPVREEEHLLKEFVDAIQEIAPKHGFAVMNLYETLGVNPNNEEECRKYTADGLHLNDYGHQHLAEKLTAFLKAL